MMTLRAIETRALRDGDVLFVRLFLFMSPETRTCRALADWPSSAGGRERPARCWAIEASADILTAAGAYHIGHSGSIDLSS